MKQLTANMKPGSSTLFVLVHKATPDKVLDEIRGTGRKILQTSLSHEDEAKLRAFRSNRCVPRISPGVFGRRRCEWSRISSWDAFSASKSDCTTRGSSSRC